MISFANGPVLGSYKLYNRNLSLQYYIYAIIYIYITLLSTLIYINGSGENEEEIVRDYGPLMRYNMVETMIHVVSCPAKYILTI